MCAGTGENASSPLKICDVCLSLGYMYKPSAAFRELGQALCERLRFLEKTTPPLPIAIVIDEVTEIDRLIRGLDAETDPNSTIIDSLANDIRNGQLRRYLQELKKKRDEAIIDLQLQVALLPRELGQAVIQAARGQYADAELLFAKALRKYEEEAVVHYHYGMYLMCYKRKYREALWQLESAVRINTQSRAAIYLAAADCASEVGSHSKAEMYYVMCTIADDFDELDEDTQRRVEFVARGDGIVN
ncbi:hypothetical protein KBC55_01860 [Patescibacteria group bacterium]|nr:hypothetical protein [Patescibacteria group bacterium]